MEPPTKPRRLRCSVQNYDWGILGAESTVARLYSKNSASEIVPDKSYAELWMGTHPSGPSFTAEEAEPPKPLKGLVSENPGLLGEKVVERWGTDLPFLFKVLSVAKALSIQAHPDKELAKVLHEAWPEVYKDSNHKPEMAVALTEFEALCGFVGVEIDGMDILITYDLGIWKVDEIWIFTLNELKTVLNSVPEFVELIGHEDANKFLHVNEDDGDDKTKTILQKIFTKLMSASKDEYSVLVSKMKARLDAENKVRTLTEKEHLALRLEKMYPSDIGVLSSFFFNYVKLKPGEALYLGANEPHAYLSGECIECMATSDNVVRAGLTPKFRDVKTLCSMLTYKQGFPEILRGIPLDSYTKRYTPPFDEFEVDRCVLPEGESVVFPAVPGPSLFIVVSGEGHLKTDNSVGEDKITEGHVFFVPAETEIGVTAASGADSTNDAPGNLQGHEDDLYLHTKTAPKTVAE
ncbi:Mannose-6-phosphate isomerase 1 [Acorus gramineus]|uniref:Mannose-6-phosphate isomerase n=1 Tax=Acorus gramineus TaxID=55184 RepID=A0AAV9AZG2_ACOGR|nr:Mannose-6-phosphate isomerase 1 [Acorus gramineus]